MRSLLGVGLSSLSLACSAPRTPPPVNTVETAIAPDAAADSLLTDVRRLDSTIVVELRYATSNNFTGTPLPGYLGNRALLRREAAAAMALVKVICASTGSGSRSSTPTDRCGRRWRWSTGRNACIARICCAMATSQVVHVTTLASPST